MKSSIGKSFRLEIIIYSLLSMFYAVLTILVLGIGVAIVYFSLGGKLPSQMNPQKDVAVTAPNSTPSPTMNSYAGNHNALANTEVEVPVQPEYDNRMIVVVVICVLFLTVALFIAYFLALTKKFSNYLNTMSEGIDEISNGNFKYVIDIKSEDEFGAMSEKINRMSNDLESVVVKSRHNEDRKHELITSVAHDLRTPLTSVIGYLDLLKSKQFDEQTRQHYLEIVYSKSKRLEQLIEDLFAYTKYTYGNVAEIKDAVDIVKLLEQLVEEFYPSFEDNELTYEFQKDCNSFISYADGNLLARAFANLIGNAIKYGADGKRVEIFFSHKAAQMKIVVKNYGKIIPEEDIPHVFDRFYRVEDSRSVETGGTGLGLAIAKSIVMMHHGEISVKSSLDGTLFEIKLPVIREPETK